MPFTIPCDPFLLGGAVAVQAIRVGAAGGCGSPVPYLTSNTIVTTIE